MNFKKEMKVDVRIAAGTAAGLLAVGCLAGWFSARARLSGDFQKRMDEETEAIRLHYLNKEAKESGPAEVLAVSSADDPAVPDLAGDFDERREWAADRDGGEEDPDQEGSGLASDADEAGRGPGKHAMADVGEHGEEDNRDHAGPYPISQAEYANTEPGWQAISLTYYAGDGVLVDDRGEPVPNYIKIVGELTPGHFGGISGEKNLRLVRNDDQECDYEIIMHETSYADEVLNYGRPK